MGEGGMHVRRLGRSAMRVNGKTRDEGVLRPGDTLGFGQSLVLLYCRRPARIPALRHFDRALAGPFGGPDGLGMVGESPAAWALRERLAFAARSNAHVLLTGASGTGKELAARAIRLLSDRPDGPFVARNAATLPEGLIDAELFGNTANYAHSSMPLRQGLIGDAHLGFLFLDEIGEIGTELQAHLLRVLDAGGEYHRLGESKARQSKFRLIAATNRDPAILKHDLLARLTIRVDVPALSERREDIPCLIRHLVERAAEKSDVAERFVTRGAGGAVAAHVDSELVEALVRRDFQLNTRELDGLLWEAMAHSEGDVIAWPRAPVATPEERRTPTASRARRRNQPAPEPAAIREALASAGGSVAEAAEILGLSSRHVLYRLMANLKIPREQS